MLSQLRYVPDQWNAIDGANIELEAGKFYIAAVHGKTLNNQLAPVPAGQGLNPLQRITGFFDFNDIRYSRRITSLMAGIGSKDGNHLHIGYLYGVGSIIPSDTSQEMPSPSAVAVETNHVVEINGRISVNENHILEMASWPFIVATTADPADRGIVLFQQ